MKKITKKPASKEIKGRSAAASVVNKTNLTMEELLSSSNYAFRGFRRGDVVEGTITSIAGREVLIDVGGKMDGVVGEKEWEDVREYVSRLRPGDKVICHVITPENMQGNMILSIRRSVQISRWNKADEMLQSGGTVTVKVVDTNKGGVLVEGEGMTGFIPSSQLASDYQQDLTKLVGKNLEVKVIEVDKTQNRLVFSEKAIAAAASRKAKLESVLTKIKAGKKYSGRVASITNYGLFVTLEDGIDGLVHISEISWEKVGDLDKLYKIGDEVEVKVLEVGEIDGKLNLSIKQLLENPWEKIAGKYAPEQKVKGTVSQVTPYGIFVNLEKGIDGLIHASKVTPGVKYEIGSKVDCTVESVDLLAHKISLAPIVTKKFVGYR